MLSIEWILAFIGLGAFVGFMAGLLGIGGGGIMVPSLTSLFILLGMPSDKVVHLALGTSMSAIVATAISSAWAHHKKQAIRWSVVKNMSVGIIIGTFIATFIVAYINAVYLAGFFSLFMFYVAIQMFMAKPRVTASKTISMTESLFTGAGIGSISALVSIGGGTLTVPYLLKRGLTIATAIGTSAAIGIFISISGTLGYLINGWQHSDMASYTLGYIYLPALLLISLASVVTAPLGAKLAHQLPVKQLKKIFALLLCGLSIKMLLVVI